MKKFVLILFIILIILSSYAQSVERVYLQIHNYHGDIDGYVEELWDGIVAVRIEKPFRDESPTVTAYFKALWDNMNLYVIIEIEDDDHWPSWELGDKNPTKWDNVEIFLDMNNTIQDGKGVINAGTGHYRQSVPYTEDGYNVPREIEPTEQDPGGTVCYSQAENANGLSTVVMKWKIPFANMHDAEGNIMDFNNLHNRDIGFDITISDQDEGLTTSRQRLVWQSDGTIDDCWNNMDGCGRLKFGPNSGISINSMKISSIKVYPNPVSDYLNCEGIFDKIEVYNVLGLCVLIGENTNEIDVENLSPASYWLKAFNGDNLIGVANFVKQ